VQPGKKRYKYLISYVLSAFKETFGGEIVLILKQISIEHMGYFKIQYKYLPLQYDIVFENERDRFVIDIFDEEGARNSLFRITKFNNELAVENIYESIVKLKKVLEEGNMCFYIQQNEKLYRKFQGEYKRVKNLYKLR